MVQLVFLDSVAPSSPSISLTSSPADSIGSIKNQLRTLHPARPTLESIRLIRGGKLLKDSESVADVLGKSLTGSNEKGEGKGDGEEETHTIHLVIKGGPGAAAVAQPPSSSARNSTAYSSQTASSSSSTTFTPASTTFSSTHTSSPQIALSHALSDAQAFYSYASRSALCTILNLPTIPWEDLMPRPIVSEEEAKAAVERFMGAFGVSAGFDGSDDGEDERVERWIPAEGASWQVEVDGLPYQLTIPPLSLLTQNQLTALQSYLSISRRIQYLVTLPSTILYSHLALAYPDSHHASSSSLAAQLNAVPQTPTTPHPAIARRRHDIRLATVVPTQLLGAIKYTMVWWIFTQNESWALSSVWAIALLAWWIYEGIKEWRRLGALDRPATATTPTPTPTPAARGTNGATNPSASSSSSTASEGAASFSSATTPPPPLPAPPLPTFTLPPSPTPAHYLSLLGLAYESHLLKLTPLSRRSSPPPSGSSSIPSPPSLLQRILLPLFLFVMTIAPPLEQHRTAAIRAREKVMREIMSTPSPLPPITTSPSPPTTSSPTPPSSTSTISTTPQTPNLPSNLTPSAKAYYLAVWKRGERIDWNAEAEAQREMQEREDRERRERENGGAAGGGGGFLAGLFM